MFVRVHVCVNGFMRDCVSVHTCVDTCASTCACACMQTCLCVYIYVSKVPIVREGLCVLAFVVVTNSERGLPNAVSTKVPYCHRLD